MEDKKVKILLAEDDKNLGMLLKEYLQAKGYKTDLVADGERAYHNFQKNQYNICILDVMMPVRDGFTVARDIRMINSDIPIIFLTAKSLKEDVFEGFNIGADDYITKPFSMEELLLRIEAVLRRTQAIPSNIDQKNIKLGKFTFDTRKQLLKIDDKIVKLTTKESELLVVFCKNRNKILDRNQALKAVWTDDSYYNARSMDVYITKLRKKLVDDPTIEIMNIHGKGFKLIDSN
jgi:DNA-binding response OmpR family regulator